MLTTSREALNVPGEMTGGSPPWRLNRVGTTRPVGVRRRQAVPPRARGDRRAVRVKSATGGDSSLYLRQLDGVHRHRARGRPCEVSLGDQIREFRMTIVRLLVSEVGRMTSSAHA